MIFWTGIFLGFGVGSCIVMLVMLYTFTKIMSGKKETIERHEENWLKQLEGQERQLRCQERQLTAIYAIAEAVREKS